MKAYGLLYLSGFPLFLLILLRAAHSFMILSCQVYGWRGLLVEPNPSSYKELLKKNRRAWSSNTCLAITPYPRVSILFISGILLAQRTAFLAIMNRTDSRILGSDISLNYFLISFGSIHLESKYKYCRRLPCSRKWFLRWWTRTPTLRRRRPSG